MSRNIRKTAPMALLLAAAAWFGFGPTAVAETVLIRNADVHTLGTRGRLPAHDVLIESGRIARIGRELAPPAGAVVIDAAGRPLTPGTFGGVGNIGLQEIGLEPSAGDPGLRLDEMRPEFDVRHAWNPDSVHVGIVRAAGVSFAIIAPSSTSHSSVVSGQGAVISLGAREADAARALFIDFGGDANGLAGGSRAAQFMLLRQALIEARSPGLVLVHDDRLLTPAGRQTVLEFLKGAGPIVFDVDRASDIRQVIAIAQAEKLRPVIRGGAEAWRVAADLAAAGIPVLLDPLENLPRSLDAIGARLDNAAKLHAAGVKFAFSMRATDSYDALKVRQAAGNAVAHGLPADVALAAITRNAAEIFGVGDRYGSLEEGRAADLVLWGGDALEVTSLPVIAFANGQRVSLQSRQTLLRDRYLQRLREGAAR
jgi:hypothetical protein